MTLQDKRADDLKAFVEQYLRWLAEDESKPPLHQQTLQAYRTDLRQMCEVLVEQGIEDWCATRSCIYSCKDSRKEDLTWDSAPSALPG